MANAGVLRRRWCAASTSEWTGDSEWWTPAVDAVSDALAHRRADPRPACKELGRQRAEAGVPLDEARADLESAVRVSGLKPGQISELIDALTVGWVNSSMDWVLASSCIDPLTELAPVSYLSARLAEVQAEARRDGVSVHDRHALVIVRTGGTTDSLERETHMITVQTVLRVAFAGGETLARIGPHCAAALVSRVPAVRLRESLAVLGAELEIAVTEGRLPSTRNWVEPIPQGTDGLPMLIRELI